MRRWLNTFLACSLLLAGFAPQAEARARHVAAGHAAAGHSTAKGVVSAPSRLAAEAGAEMLRQGGSAVDAALATAITLTVLEPESTGIGGGGFMVAAAPGRRLATIDGREAAPAAAGSDWFVRDGAPMGFRAAVLGGRSVGIPGFIRLAERAHRRFGRVPWRSLFQPAIRLARDGFPISERLFGALTIFHDAAVFDGGKALYFDASGAPLPAGTVIRNPELAKLLQQVADHGPDAFYTGQNAAAIVSAVSGAKSNQALWTMADLKTYAVQDRAPVCGHYRRYRLCSMGPPASGAVTLLQILGQLERFDLKATGPESPVSWHLFAESTRLAFADRAQYVGDPAFNRVPVAGLIAPEYISSRSALIAPDRSMASASAGHPAGAAITALVAPGVENGTSHVAASDRRGGVASFTSTIESGFGSGLVVNGYFLNNELTDFDLAPPPPGTITVNSVAAGKRPRSAMTPVIAYGPDGHLAFAIGAGGGATIVVQVAKAIVGVIDWGLPFDRAISLPLVFAPGDTVQLEQGSAAESLAPTLTALGHRAKAQPMRLKANAVYWDGKAWHGAADTRSEGATVSE